MASLGTLASFNQRRWAVRGRSASIENSRSDLDNQMREAIAVLDPVFSKGSR